MPSVANSGSCPILTVQWLEKANTAEILRDIDHLNRDMDNGYYSGED
ncbi:MAG: hypothetical protein KDN22_09525 [Verrucomicrobiae bacterium]|nr:hypothetical protein [Verrucomicrobiae bacterium]